MEREKFIAVKIDFNSPGPQVGINEQKSFTNKEDAVSYINNKSYEKNKELWLIVKEPAVDGDKLEIIQVKKSIKE